MRFSGFIAGALLLGALSCNSGSNPTGEEAGKKDQLSAGLISRPNSANGTNPADAAKMATLDFKDSVYDFGVIHDGEIVSREFEFTNNGKSPLLISSATATCGCTVPEYPRDPVQPGAGGRIKVSFNSAGKSGSVEKTVTITDNSFRGNHYVKIKAEVKPK